MKEKSVLLVLFCFCTLALGGVSATALAGSLSPQGGLRKAAKDTSSAIPAGCGWDYPCPQVPAYARPRAYRQPGVYIRNNYGTVNIETRGRIGHETAPDLPPPCCETAAELSRQGGWPAPCGPEPCGYEPPKEVDCGVRCWWRRFKEGYCGHGCLAYREQARAEADERERKEERRAEIELEKRQERWDREPDRRFYSPAYEPSVTPSPAYEKNWRDEPLPRVERPHVDERTPLGRFEGPKYPPD